jgi:hypothetical protein
MPRRAPQDDRNTGTQHVTLFELADPTVSAIGMRAPVRAHSWRHW